jgi:hypothetical protein
MISINLAKQLKVAGLVWQADINDFFAIPDRGMDDRVFVLSDMQAQLDIFRGWPVITFHGTAEWALDYILTSEVIWMPRDEQLRDALLSHLSSEDSGKLCLNFEDNLYTCSLFQQDELIQVTASSAADAYAKALLQLFKNRSST